jgi:hypothetical protein
MVDVALLGTLALVVIVVGVCGLFWLRLGLVLVVGAFGRVSLMLVVGHVGSRFVVNSRF